MGRIAGFEKKVALNASGALFPKFVMRPCTVVHEFWNAMGAGKPTIRVPLVDLKVPIARQARGSGISGWRHQSPPIRG
jgi:hypothetical protein